MKSVMSKDFSRVAQTDIQRSTFDRSHGLKTAFDSGYLIPIELQEVVPSDEVSFDARFLARLAPVVTPVMDNVFLDLHAFFVPSRLVWNNFTKMMGERVNPKDSIDYLVPTCLIDASGEGGDVGGLADYFGLPVQQGVSRQITKVSSLPFRAYQKIYDDWYRDENLQDSVIQTTDELGDRTISNLVDDDKKWFKLRKRGKRHDYFTSCLPWPQKGDSVSIGISGSAKVVPDGEKAAPKFGWKYNTSGNESSSNFAIQISTTGTGATNNYLRSASNTGIVAYWQDPALKVDMATATAMSVNNLRMAFQLQRLLEADARGGTRYVEIVRNHFKTICPDARLQRSEFLGAATVPITFSPVAQTSGTTDTSPQGNLAATAHAFTTFKFRRAFSEHGYLIVLASVRCDLNYQQGIDKLWLRSGRYDFYWPTLAHLGEQAVLNKEIYYQGTEADEDVFGYQERYAEMRYNPSRITGKMRSGVDGSLDVWHLAQEFSSLPVLSPEFIEENPPLDRVLAVAEGEPQILLDCYLGQRWTRPLPLYSIPGLIDHF